MGRVRHLIRRHPAAAWALIALALAMRLVVPGGFMPQVSGGGVALVLCDGMAHGEAMAATMSGMAGHDHDGHAPGKADAPCPYAGLTAPTLGGADPVQLASLILAIVSAALFIVAPRPPRTAAHLRPPLRGPPALA